MNFDSALLPAFAGTLCYWGVRLLIVENNVVARSARRSWRGWWIGLLGCFLICIAFGIVARADGPDLDGDLDVDGADVGLIIGNWGLASPLDLTGDGVIDGADLGVVLGAWSGPGVLWRPLAIDNAWNTAVVPAGRDLGELDGRRIAGVKRTETVWIHPAPREQAAGATSQRREVVRWGEVVYIHPP